MTEFIKLIFSNHILNTAVLAWFFAQLIKGIIESVRAKKILIDRFFGSGGMPSSHSSLVTSLLTMVLLIHGVASTEFAIAAVFWFVTTYDAANVRYAVGEQAKIINQIIRIDERVEREKLFKELMGHTKIEIFFGCLLGLAIALIYRAVFIA
jgi:acid phosphatase family membrane protein YuiD